MLKKKLLEDLKEPAEETTEEPPFVIEGLEIVQEQHEDSDPIESQEPLQQPNQEESLEPQEPQEQPKPFSIEKVKDVDMVEKISSLLAILEKYHPKALLLIDSWCALFPRKASTCDMWQPYCLLLRLETKSCPSVKEKWMHNSSH